MWDFLCHFLPQHSKVSESRQLLQCYNKVRIVAAVILSSSRIVFYIEGSQIGVID